MPRPTRKSGKPLDPPVNGLLRELLALKDGAPDKVPFGHMTAAKWARAWNRNANMTNVLLRLALKHKKMGMRKYRIPCGRRKGMFPVPHYWIL